MIYFNNDYSEGCHPRILEALTATNFQQTPGYGMDDHCRAAADKIKELCGREELDVHFLVGGTQANLTVIDAALRPYQAVICAESGHIHVHETGAVEATGHKVLALPSADGKITAQQVDELCSSYFLQDGPEHMVSPRMVYISHPTELGTLYTRRELEELSRICRKWGQALFLDGARLGYGMAAPGSDVGWAELAACCDVFYIGGTKVGALFGEAVVFTNREIARDFRFMIKQHGGMLAKGRLLGLQFKVLLEDGLYLRIASRAVALADKIRACLASAGYPLLLPGDTNQIFTVLPDVALQALNKDFCFNYHQRMDDTHSAVRICTSWATREEDVAALCDAIKNTAAITK